MIVWEIKRCQKNDDVEERVKTAMRVIVNMTREN